MSIRDNLEAVEARIAAACEKAGRKRDDVKLVAVSKTKPAEAVQEDYKLKAKTGGKPKSRLNSAKAHTKWLRRQQEQEGLRQKLKEVWNKNKKT